VSTVVFQCVHFSPRFMLEVIVGHSVSTIEIQCIPTAKGDSACNYRHHLTGQTACRQLAESVKFRTIQ